MTKKTKPEQQPAVLAYKGFDKDLRCSGGDKPFQYEIGKCYEHKGDVQACESGFHACEYPLDVFNYYPPAGSRFATVEQTGQISRHGDDRKLASSKITIRAELDLAGLVKAAIEYTTSRCKPVDPASPASATGTRGAASATGTRGAASATGDQGAASATGYQGAASATGDQGAASATGDQGAASATGTRGAACASGRFGRAKGAEGCCLFLVYRDDNYIAVHAKAAIVGRDGIKADTWYELSEAGEFVEVQS